MNELTEFIDLLRVGSVAAIIALLVSLANMIMLITVLSRLPRAHTPPQWQAPYVPRRRRLSRAMADPRHG